MNIAAKVDKVIGGVLTLASWVGDGGIVVDQELAQSRTDVCLRCPNNKAGSVVTETVAKAIKSQVALRNKLGLRTRGIKSLKTCAVCECYLPLKIFIPIDNLNLETTPEELDKFPDFCWLRTENK